MNIFNQPKEKYTDSIKRVINEQLTIGVKTMNMFLVNKLNRLIKKQLMLLEQLTSAVNTSDNTTEQVKCVKNIRKLFIFAMKFTRANAEYKPQLRKHIEEFNRVKIKEYKPVGTRYTMYFHENGKVERVTETKQIELDKALAERLQSEYNSEYKRTR